MTLVIAKKLQNKVIILSDTLISYGEKHLNIHKYDKECSTIKTIIINKNICIAFAGKNYYAEKALIDISQSEKNKNGILDILVKYNSKSAGETDFIAYFGKPYYELYIIKELKEPLLIECGYIGSPSAYKKYRSIYDNEKDGQSYINESVLALNKLPDSFSEEYCDDYNRMRNALLGVINSTEKSVGGFVTSLVYEKDEMKYLPSFISNKKISDFKDLPNITSSGIDYKLGSVENGDYAQNLIFNNDFIAVHFPINSIGVIYNRNDGGLYQPSIIARYDEIDFFDYLESEKGYNRELSVLVNHTEQNLTIKGNLCLNRNEYSKAVGYYNRAELKLIEYKSEDTNFINDYRNALLLYLEIKDFFTSRSMSSANSLDFSEYLKKIREKLNRFTNFIDNISDSKALFSLKEGYKNVLYQRGIAYYKMATLKSNDYKLNLIKAYIDFYIVKELQPDFDKINVLYGSTLALLSL